MYLVFVYYSRRVSQPATIRSIVRLAAVSRRGTEVFLDLLELALL